MHHPLTICLTRLLTLCVCLLASGCLEDDPRYDPEDHFEEGALGVLKAGMTVEQAGGCSTSIVAGLSRQLIEQINCLRPNTLEDFSRADIRQGAGVWPYAQRGGRAALWRAIDQRGQALSLNSALRTLPQQYLLYQWYQQGRCGIGLAARPGRSRHESGLAIDTGDWAAWRDALGANSWQWFGQNDAVHFDYRGADTVDLAGLSVLAFQQLWNLNHPEDTIDEDGAYGPQTEARLRQSPAEGFAQSGCVGPGPDPTPDQGVDPELPGDRYMSILAQWATLDGQPRDWLLTGSSARIFDVVEGQQFEGWIDVRNGSGRPVTEAVTLGYTTDSPFIDALSVEILTDLPTANGAQFVPVDPNSGPRPLPGPDGFFSLGVIQPGETRRARIILEAVQPTIGQIRHAQLRAWVREVPGYYEEQLSWEDAVEVNQNVDRLQSVAEADVLSVDRWRFEGPDSGDAEGWRGCDGAALSTDLAERALSVPGACVDGPPWMAVDTDRFNALRVVVRHGGPIEGTLRWRDDRGQLGASPIAANGGGYEALVVPLEGARGAIISAQLEWPGAAPWLLDLIEGSTVGGPVDEDGDGWPPGPIPTGDCDDADPLRFPGAPERCDGVDGDCDGRVDEGLTCDEAPPAPDAAVPPAPGDRDASVFDPEDPFVEPDAGGAGFGGAFGDPGGDLRETAASVTHTGGCQGAPGSPPTPLWLLLLWWRTGALRALIRRYGQQPRRG